MTSFRDRVLLQLSDPAALGALLRPAGDTGHQLVNTVLAAAYDLSAVRIDQVTDVAVDELELQRPLFRTDRLVGSWTRSVPSYTRTELDLDRAGSRDPAWIDVLARLRITVVAEIDPAGAESVAAVPVEGFTTLEQFRQLVPFLDLDAFMAEHGLTTVADLRNAFHYLSTTVRLRAAEPFDPDDPANVHVLKVALAAVAVDPFDLAAGLRAARLIRETGRTSGGPAAGGLPAESTASFAPAAVFAATGPADNGTTAAAVVRLFAKAGVAALFLTTG
ncbi:hypothetical protein ACGFNU_00180 [Spirillospora sp. NPDC048911]|uniref:hypothetical protein n=1 Tax=Spirillospora sp. NPDC048911 TaxID=3364527 RepID=UPI003724ADC4